MQPPPSQLSLIERGRLETLEQIIEDGLPMAFAIGKAILSIKQQKLYREYANWPDYCERRWGFTPQHAGYLTRGYTMRAQLEKATKTETIGFSSEVLPSNERAIRPLSKVPAKNRAKAYAKAVELAGGRRPTSQHVSDAVVVYERPRRPADAPAAPADRKPAFTSDFDQAWDVLSRAHEYFCFTIDNTLDKQQQEIQCARMQRALDLLKFYSPTYSLFDLPEWVPRDLWDKFVIMRGKKSITAHAFQLLMEALRVQRDAGHNVSEVINETILKNWASFYPPNQYEKARADRQQEARQRDVATAKVEYLTEEEYNARQNGEQL